ncbi:MAG TPA: phage terminase large subunit [Abditibacteriaceae bacterium]
MAGTAKSLGVPRDQFRNFVSTGIVLQERQWAASAAARLCDAEDGPDYIGYGGARGGGKSHWLFTQLACDDCQRMPGIKCLLLRKSGKAVKEQVRDLLRLLKGLEYTWTPSDGLGVIEFKNGSKIILGHFKDDKDIDAYLGLEYDVIGIEEATTLSKSKVDDILTCLRTSKPNWRPRSYFTTNPGNIGHAWFKAMFIKPLRDGNETETRFISASVTDNSFVDKGYIKKLSRMSGWKKKAWLDGDWDVMVGQFFSNWKEKWNGKPHHVREKIEVMKGWSVWLSLDYGFNHYTVVYLLAQDGDGNVYIIDEHAARGWHIKRHADAVRAMLKRNGIKYFRIEKFVAGTDVFSRDYEGNTIAAKYEEAFADEGFTLEAATTDRINGAAEILARLGDTEALDENKQPKPILPTLFIAQCCTRLIECLPLLQHDVSRPDDVKKWDCDEEGAGGDDPYDAFRYGVMAARRTSSESTGSF